MPHEDEPRSFLITAVARSDRPGMMATLSRALMDVGANLEDCRAVRLRGLSGIMLVVTMPESANDSTLEAALGSVGDALEYVRFSVDEAGRAAFSEEGWPCIIQVTGADRPGIVHAFASAMADLGLNIHDVLSKMDWGRESGDARYSLVMRTVLPLGVEPTSLVEKLGDAADQHGCNVGITVLRR